MITFNNKTYFTEDELKCRGSGKLILADGFTDRLLEFRLALGKPMIITSACRSEEHNRKVGGASNSYHICDNGRGTLAVDVRCNNARDRLELVKLGIELNWSVGVNDLFIHLDMRSLLGIPPVLFTY